MHGMHTQLGTPAPQCGPKRCSALLQNHISPLLPCCPVPPAPLPADKQETRQMLNLRWGVSPFRMDFSADSAEDSIYRAFKVHGRLGWAELFWTA